MKETTGIMPTIRASMENMEWEFKKPTDPEQINAAIAKKEEYYEKFSDESKPWGKIHDIYGNHDNFDEYKMLYYKFVILSAVLNAPNQNIIDIREIKSGLLLEFGDKFDREIFDQACEIIQSKLNKVIAW